MNTDIGRDLSERPIAKIMALHGLKAHDLVARSTGQITYKMVSRAVKGRCFNTYYTIQNIERVEQRSRKSLRDNFIRFSVVTPIRKLYHGCPN